MVGSAGACELSEGLRLLLEELGGILSAGSSEG